MFKSIFSLRALALAALAVVTTGASSAQSPYKILDHWTIGGTGGWDYMFADAGAHRLYVSHGPQVDVVDTTTGKLTGTITGLQRTHGIVVDDAGKDGYITDSGLNAVVVFDRTTLKVVKTIAAGTGPDGEAWEPVTRTIWAFNGRSNNVTVIDSTTNEMVATIALPGRPEFPQTDGKGFVYDNLESTNQVVKIDARTKKIVATWTLKDCDGPSGLAIDREHMKLFSVCDGKKAAVLDAETGKQLASPEIGDGPDAAGASSKLQLAFSSNGAGTLSVVDLKGYKTIEDLPTERGARTMAYDAETDTVYLVSAKFGPTPAATAAMPRPRPAVLPGSFEVIVVGRNKPSSRQRASWSEQHL
jgi:YVTN family beta-propeller protein